MCLFVLVLFPWVLFDLPHPNSICCCWFIVTSVTCKYFSGLDRVLYSYIYLTLVHGIHLWDLSVWCCEVRYLKKLNFFSPVLWNVHGVLYMLRIWLRVPGVRFKEDGTELSSLFLSEVFDLTCWIFKFVAEVVSIAFLTKELKSFQKVLQISVFIVNCNIFEGIRIFCLLHCSFSENWKWETRKSFAIHFSVSLCVYVCMGGGEWSWDCGYAFVTLGLVFLNSMLICLFHLF